MDKKEWFYDEAFWEQFAPIMFDAARWDEAPRVADGVTSLARLDLYRSPRKEAPAVLDLCCGFGRISLELARRGFAVTGVDITESFLRTAGEDASREGLDIEFVREDARLFSRDSVFDIAVNLYISFGYFENEKDDVRVLSNVYRSLREGGSFVMETLGKEIAVRDFVTAEWFERAGYTVLTEYAPSDSWAGLRNRWIRIDGAGGRIEKEFTQRLYAASELRSLFLGAGFSSVEIYGDWNESPYDQNAGKLIVVGRK